MRVRTILFLVAAALAAVLPSAPARAQAISWTDVNGVPGIGALREGADGRLFAVAGTRIYYSTDGGGVWLQPPAIAGTVEVLQCNGADQIVSRFVGGVINNHQLFRSSDNGATWTRIYSETTSQFAPGLQHFIMGGGDTVYAIIAASTVSTQVIRAVPNGPVPVGVPAPLVGTGGGFGIPAAEIFARDRSGVLYMGTRGGGLYVSADNAATWRQALPNAVSALAVSPAGLVVAATDSTFARDGGVFSSADHGVTWTNLGLVEAQFNAVSADAGGNVLASSPGGNSYYDAASGAWSYVGPTEHSAGDLLISAAGSLFASSPSVGVYRSGDKGSSWSLNGPRIEAVLAVLTLSSGTMMAGTLGDGLFRSTNQGAGWEQPAGLPDDVNGLAAAGSTAFAATSEGVWSSDDDGLHWTSRLSSIGPVQCLAVDAAGAIYAGTQFGVYRSGDGGAAWSPAGLSGRTIRSLASSPNGRFYAATASDGIFVTTDGGATWVPRGLVRNDIQTIGVNPAGDLFAGVYGGILRSRGDTSAFVQHLFASTYVYALAFNGTQQVYAGTYGGAYASFDDGDDWAAAGLNGIPVLSLAFGPDNRLAAGTYHAGVYRSAQAVLGVVDSPALHPVPRAFRLYDSYPNPFNPSTTIRFDLASRAPVSVRIYAPTGALVDVVAEGEMEPGTHALRWNARSASSGVYFCRVEAGKYTAVTRLVLLK